MSRHGNDGVMHCLFSRQGMELDNIKFFRGDATLISADQFRDELCDASDRKRSGEVVASGNPPKCVKAPIDVRNWEAIS